MKERKEERNELERKADIKVSSCSENGKKKQNAAESGIYINGLRCNTYNNIEYEDRHSG